MLSSENKNNAVRVCEKYSLTISEAVSYFGIGEKKLRKMIEDNRYANWVFQNGVKYMIKRQLFETYLNGVSAI